MSIEDVEKIDAIGLELSSGSVVLTILDSSDWSDEKLHALYLQRKLNAYFGFVESGQVVEVFPESQNRSVRIDILSRHEYSSLGIWLLEKARTVAESLGIEIRYAVSPG